MTTIKLRGDTAANWAAVNPVLSEREMGLDLTNKNFRVGDGQTVWGALTDWIQTSQGGGGSIGHVFTSFAVDEYWAIGAWRTMSFTISVTLSQPANVMFWPNIGLGGGDATWPLLAYVRATRNGGNYYPLGAYGGLRPTQITAVDRYSFWPGLASGLHTFGLDIYPQYMQPYSKASSQPDRYKQDLLLLYW